MPNTTAFIVEHHEPPGVWQPHSWGRSLDEAIAPLGGRDWYLHADRHTWRVRAPGGVVFHPLGGSGGTDNAVSLPQPQAGQPQPAADGPRVRVSYPSRSAVPVPVPVPSHEGNRPMSPQKFALSRSGRTVRVFDTADEANRARVVFSRHDKAGNYSVTAMSSEASRRFARGGPGGREDEPGAEKKRDRWVVEIADGNGGWERASDTFDSASEAIAELQRAVREDGFTDEARVVRLKDSEPDELPDADDQGEPAARGGRGSYPTPRPVEDGDGDERDQPPGKPMKGGPSTPREAVKLARFARAKGVTAQVAWGMMQRGY